MTLDTLQEIANLHSLNLSPQQIARKLGVPLVEVYAVLQEHTHSGVTGVVVPKGLPPIAQCVMNASAVKHLLPYSPCRGWMGQCQPVLGADGRDGLAQIFVVRAERGQYLVSSYLVDYWCVGVKHTFGPWKMARRQYQMLLERTSEKFDQAFCDIMLEEAQSIVFGAVDYASGLGLRPHKDYERSKVQLGQRPQPLIEMAFGYEGQPFYISGPHDNSKQIIAILREHVGEGNFHVMNHISG